MVVRRMILSVEVIVGLVMLFLYILLFEEFLFKYNLYTLFIISFDMFLND